MDAGMDAVQRARLVPGLRELLSTPAASQYFFPGKQVLLEAAPAL